MNLTVLLTLPGSSKPGGDINKLLHFKLKIKKRRARNSPYYRSQPPCVNRRWPHKAEPEVGHASFKKAGEHSLVRKHLQGSGFNPQLKGKTHTKASVQGLRKMAVFKTFQKGQVEMAQQARALLLFLRVAKWWLTTFITRPMRSDAFF